MPSKSLINTLDVGDPAGVCCQQGHVGEMPLHDFCFLAQENLGSFLVVANFFFSFIVLFDGIVVGERKNIYFDRTFFLLACIFSYFFRFFFYSLQPTHFQPHRKTTGEITFEVKRDLIMLLLLHRNLQIRVGGKSQVTNPPYQHPLSSFIPPHFHKSWLQPQRSCRPEAMDRLVTIHGHITVSCNLCCKELVTRNS